MVPLLEAQHILKQYPGVLALDDVSLSLHGGEVLCLVGENGAGKSTLVKILSGACRRDRGTIRIDGVAVPIQSPAAALRQGIGVIFQDFKLVPDLSAAENILLGNEPNVGFTPFVDRRQLFERAHAAMRPLGFQIDLRAPVSTLGAGERQMVEIAKALSRRVRVLAMDEPTASLSQREIAALFEVIRRLRAEGVGIIYISHRLDEIFRIGDRVTVLRDGRIVAASPLAGVDRGQLIRWMVGRDLDQEYPKVGLPRGSPMLRVQGLSGPGLQDICFELFRGEVLGFAGLVGAGRTQLAHVLFGAAPRRAGRVLLDEAEIVPTSPREAVRLGIGLLTEDRNRYGLILQMCIRENVSLPSLDDVGCGPFINRRKEKSVVRRYVQELQIRPADLEVPVEILSGGNRQKVVIARWLNTSAKLLIFDEPTAGIDVGARYEIYCMINRLAAAGVGIILISSDLPELLGMCDRIAVMCRGRLSGVLSRAEATQERVMTLATTPGSR